MQYRANKTIKYSKLTTNYLPKLIKGALFTLILITPVIAPAAEDFQGNLRGVTISDANGTNQPPTASFIFSSDGNTITVDASASSDSDGTISEYKWDFGDGTTGVTGTTAQHDYASYGTYAVNLTVSDDSGGIAIISKPININLPAQFIGNETTGTASMKNYPNYIYFHKLQGTPSSEGALNSYTVTIQAAAASGRAINIALYTHDSTNDKPLSYINGSETGWLEYSQDTGEALVAQPTGSPVIEANAQYWVGIRGKNYGGIRGESFVGTYYGYYLGGGSLWKNADILGEGSVLTGTAGKLQIEVTQ